MPEAPARGHLRENSPLCLVPKVNRLWAVTQSSRKGRLPPVSFRKAGPKCRWCCRDLASSKDQPRAVSSPRHVNKGWLACPCPWMGGRLPWKLFTGTCSHKALSTSGHGQTFSFPPGRSRALPCSGQRLGWASPPSPRGWGWAGLEGAAVLQTGGSGAPRWSRGGPRGRPRLRPPQGAENQIPE